MDSVPTNFSYLSDIADSNYIFCAKQELSFGKTLGGMLDNIDW